MARIPQYISSGQVGSGVRGGGAIQQPSDIIGRSLQQAGANVQQAGNILQQKEDEKSLTEASKLLAQHKARWQEEMITRQQNAPAGADGFTDTITADYDASVTELLDGVSNDKARAYLERNAITYGGSLTESSLRFEAGARIAYKKSNLQEAADLNANILLSDPGQFASLYEDTVAGIAASGLPEQDIIDATDAAGATLGWAAVNGEIPQNPWKVKEDLKKGRWDDYLDPQAKKAAMNAADREIKSLEAEAKAKKNEEKWLFGKEHGATLVMLEQGLEPESIASEQEYVDMYGESQGKALFREIDMARGAGQVFASVSEDPANAQKYINEYMSDIDGREDIDTAMKLKYKAEAMRVAENALNDFEQDKAGFAVKTNAPTAEALQAVLDDQGNPDAWATYINRQDAFQEQQGVPKADRTYIPEVLAAQIKSGLETAAPEEVWETVRNLQSVTGLDWGQISDELDIKGPMMVMDAISPEAGRLLAGAMQSDISRDELRKSVDSSTDFNASLDEALAPMLSSLALQDGGSRYMGAFRDSIETTALMLKRSTPTMSDDEAISRAAQMTIGYSYNFSEMNNGNYLRIPKQLNQDTIEEGIGRYFQDLPGVEGDALRDALHENARWVINGDETGVELVDPSGMVQRNAAGDEITLTWDEAQRYAASRRIDTSDRRRGPSR